MSLPESQAIKIINIYLNLCNTYSKEGEITDRNFNRIREIDRYIGNRQKDIKLVWGDIFDEVYDLLNRPEVKSKLDQEKLDLQKIKEQKKLDKKHLDTANKKNKPLPNKAKAITQVNKKKKQKIKNKKQETSLKICIQCGNYIDKGLDLQHKYKCHLMTKLESTHQYIEYIKEDLLKQKRFNQKHKVMPPFNFDSKNEILEDIMDERKAEGKGYSGSK